MKKNALEKNREYSDSFKQNSKNHKVPAEIRNIIIKNKVKSMIDLGCGDGILIKAIKESFPETKITGVDISPRRISDLKKIFPEDNFYVGDVCNLKIKKQFDFVYSSQVIEHVDSDLQMIGEMHKLLKKNGVLFCSSVIKKPWAIYQYRNNGKFVLDPTHEKEYSDVKEFLDLFKKNFELIDYSTSKVRRRKFGIKIVIPGFYQISGIWRKK